MTESSTKSYPNVTQSFGITGIIIIGIFLFSPILSVLNKLIGEEASTLIYYLLSTGIPFWIFYSIRKSKTNCHSFNITIENKRIIPLVILGSIALVFGIISPITDLIPMPEIIKKAFLEFGSQTGIFAFFLTVIAAPILEELIFRGIILDGLLQKYSPAKSILISSFLFGLAHLNPWQFVAGFIIGIFSGWVYFKTRSLSFSIIIHAAGNLGGFLTGFFIDIDSYMDMTLLEMYGSITNLSLVVLSSVFIVAACIYFLRKEFKRSKTETPMRNTFHT